VKNFEGRRGKPSEEGDGVVTYSEPSITAGNNVFTKAIPQISVRRILREDEANRAMKATA
jgi:hypothetical protein